MNKNILHLCFIDKFIPDFIELVRNKVKTNTHTFITMGSNYQKYPVKKGNDLTFLSGRYLRYFTIIRKLNEADKIMLHGLFDPGVIILLFLQPWLLKKCYWVMWGGDIYYSPRKTLLGIFVEFCKKRVARNIGYLVACVEGDVEHVRKIYGAQGVHKYSIMYLSNCFKCLPFTENNYKPVLHIQLGNSGDTTNNHYQMLDKLYGSLSGEFKIFAPLSYGNKKNIEAVVNKGKEYFGDKFIPMLDFMSLESYTAWQQSIDIAIFAHKRQQGMGNIITLLGLGKTIYMHNDLSSTTCLKQFGLAISDINNDHIEVLPSNISNQNIDIIKHQFSTDSLIKQLNNLFD